MMPRLTPLTKKQRAAYGGASSDALIADIKVVGFDNETGHVIIDRAPFHKTDYFISIVGKRNGRYTQYDSNTDFSDVGQAELFAEKEILSKGNISLEYLANSQKLRLVI